jgi:gas vesicle protein
MEEKSGFGYFLLGLGIGVTVGVLWAPRTGEETRQLIADRASEGADYLKERAQEGTEYVRQRAQDGSEFVKQRAHEGGEYVKQRAQEGSDVLKQRAADVQNSASELYEKGRDTVNRQKDTLAAAVEAGKQAYREAVSDINTKSAGTGSGTTA